MLASSLGEERLQFRTGAPKLLQTAPVDEVTEPDRYVRLRGFRLWSVKLRLAHACGLRCEVNMYTLTSDVARQCRRAVGVQ